MPDFILCCDSLKPSPLAIVVIVASVKFCFVTMGVDSFLQMYPGIGTTFEVFFSFSNETLHHLQILIFTSFAETRIPCTYIS